MNQAVGVYKEIGPNDIALFVLCFLIVFSVVYYVVKIRPDEIKNNNQTWGLMRESMVRQESLMSQCNSLLSVMNKSIEVQTETLSKVTSSNDLISKQVAVLDEKVLSISKDIDQIHLMMRGLATTDQLNRAIDRTLIR